MHQGCSQRWSALNANKHLWLEAAIKMSQPNSVVSWGVIWRVVGESPPTPTCYGTCMGT